MYKHVQQQQQQTKGIEKLQTCISHLFWTNTIPMGQLWESSKLLTENKFGNNW
jgi:hypothetical protein